jgi:hypothetical protein
VEKVRLKKDQLLKILRDNREVHAQQYADAVEGFYATVLEKLRELHSRLEARELVSYHINEVPPESHVKDYDRAIKKLEMTLDTEIELSDHEFARYVENTSWDWSNHWEMSNSKYVAMSAAMKVPNSAARPAARR